MRQELSPKSDADAASPVLLTPQAVQPPRRSRTLAPSQWSLRSLSRRLSSGLFGDKKKNAKESRVPVRTLLLKGHTDWVRSLVALDGGRLASGSDDKSVIICNLADGTQLAKLEGHAAPVMCLAVLADGRLASGSSDNSVIIWNLAGTHSRLAGHEGPVYCLAVLDGGRLASGSYDNSIIIWSLADGKQLAKLEGHAGPVYCLAALADARLASGSGDNSIITWNLADDSQPGKLEGHKLEGHTGSVQCLTTLDGDRLASGSDDNTIICWNLKDGTQLANLEGHAAPVMCLAVLADGRLASGSSDNSVIIWNLADCKQLTKLEGHTTAVFCLAALDGTRLASGGADMTIRVRPLTKLADIAVCGSAFEFEEVARGCRDKSCLGDLFDAAVVQSDENMGGSSDSIKKQAKVFDAIAKVANEKDTSKSINSLAPSVLSLVRDDALLPDMKRRGVSKAAIQELAPTALFRVVLDAKFADGPVFVLYFELFLFVVLGCCFTRVAAFEVLDVSKWIPSEKIIETVVAFVVLAYFSVREICQMVSTRAIELATLEDPLWNEGVDEFLSGKVEGLARWALLIPRLLVGFMALLPFLPVFLVFTPLQYAGKDYDWMNAFGNWFAINILESINHDPLTFLGLSRAWRRDYWNWIDSAALGCAWAAFARAAMPGGDLSADLAAVTTMLLWLRLFGFLKHINQSLATFVLMFERIVRDLRVFMVFFLMITLMFGSAFYLYLGQQEAEEYGFHDDGAPSAFESVKMTIFSLLLLGFIGDYDLDNYPSPADRTYLVLFLVVVVIIQLNILIAIVSDSYDAAMAKREALYYRAHLELVAETAWATKRLPRRLLPTIDEDWIKERLAAALEESEDGDDQGRINYTSQKTRAMVQADTRRVVAALEERIAGRIESMDAKFDEVLRLLRARPGSDRFSTEGDD